MKHISIDLETASSNSDASIFTIGGASSGGSYFYIVVDDPGGSWSPDTVRWLAQQEQSKQVVGVGYHRYPLYEALTQFSKWLGDLGAGHEGAVCIWTHATFDMPVLETAYQRAGIKRPWHYRNCRDLRTLYWLAGGRPQVIHTGKHHALNDAEALLREVKECLRILGDAGVQIRD